MTNLLQDVFGGSQSKSQGQFTSTPGNFQNSAFTNLAPQVASGLSNLFSLGNTPGINATGANATGQGDFNFSNNNSLVAPITGQQSALVGQAGAQATPTTQQGQANNFLSTVLNPAWLNTASNPLVQNLVSSSVAPLLSAWNQQVMPNLTSQATQAGQQANSTPSATTPGGSSAFGRNVALAGTNLGQQVAQTAAGIELPAFENAVQQAQSAATQANAFPTMQLNNTINALQASALPQLTQQYGINQALQLFQTRIQQIMTALGMGAQAAQPVVANTSQGTNSSSSNSSNGILSAFAPGAAGASAGGNVLGGVGSLFSGIFGGGAGAAAGAAGAGAAGAAGGAAAGAGADEAALALLALA